VRQRWGWCATAWACFDRISAGSIHERPSSSRFTTMDTIGSAINTLQLINAINALALIGYVGTPP
jgi:hypothetical protein